MCRNVICAQLLNVGVSPSSMQPIHVNSRFASSMGRTNGSGNSVPLYHHPFPTPRSSPSLVFGISIPFSLACGMV